MADGNFKADHVRQKNESGDVWLSEGGGMIPKRCDYMDFLKSAIERLTVSAFFKKISAIVQYAGPYRCRACNLVITHKFYFVY